MQKYFILVIKICSENIRVTVTLEKNPENNQAI